MTKKAVYGVVLLFATVQLGLQLSLLARGIEYVTASLTIDDTYYYLQTAWNVKALGFATFDGRHATNGVQLLWFGIILLLAYLVETKTALLFATMVVTFLLNALCYLVILQLGVFLRRPMVALFLAGLWSLQSLPFRIYSMGMENSLHALVFWGVTWQSVVFLSRVKVGLRPNFWALTIVLILNAWTRLDAALLSAVLYGYCLLQLGLAYRHNIDWLVKRDLASVAGTGLLAVLGLAVQLASFWWLGGAILPVSALVKTSGASRGLSIEGARKFLEVLVLGMPSVLQGRLPVVALTLLGLLGVGLVLWARRSIPKHSSRLGALIDLWTCMLGGELLYHVYIALSGVEYTLYFAWYRSPSFIFWVITGALIAYFTYKRLAAFKRWPALILRASFALSLSTFALAIYFFIRSIAFQSQLYAVRYEAALWIAEHTSPDTTFAAWNAGQLGYFSNRTFINLDGVINSVDYYSQVLHGPTPLSEYLAANNVSYVVDYAIYDTLDAFGVVQRFPLNDGSDRSIAVWQVSTYPSAIP
jgi:hypothetical protein